MDLYIEHRKNSYNLIRQSKKKIGKDLSRDFIKENIQMANNPMQRC